MEKCIQNNVEFHTTSPQVIEEAFVCDDIVEETKMDVSSLLDVGKRVKAYTLEEFQRYGKEDMERFVDRLMMEGVNITGLENINTSFASTFVQTSRGDVKFETFLIWYKKVVGFEPSIKKSTVLDHFLLNVCGAERVKTIEIKVPYTLKEFQRYGRDDMLRFVEQLNKDGIHIKQTADLNSSDKFTRSSVPTKNRGDVKVQTYLQWYRKAVGLEEFVRRSVVLDHFLLHVCGVQRGKIILQDRKVPYTLEEFQRFGKEEMLKFVERINTEGAKITGIEGINVGMKMKSMFVPTSVRGDVKFYTYLQWYRKAVGWEETVKYSVVLDHFLLHVCGVERMKILDIKIPYSFEEFQEFGKNDMQRFVERLQKDGMNISAIVDLNTGVMLTKFVSTNRGDVMFITYLRWYQKIHRLTGCTWGQVLAHMKLSLLSSASQVDRRELVEEIDSRDEEYL